MDGVMILNTMVEPIHAFGWNNWCFLLLIPIFIAIYLICFWYINRDHPKTKCWGILGLVILIISLSAGYGICSTKNAGYEKTYQVIVNNNVDMEQFRSNYEILEQVGITYIIRQK